MLCVSIVVASSSTSSFASYDLFFNPIVMKIKYVGLANQLKISYMIPNPNLK
jgi:hypothetical protein